MSTTDEPTDETADETADGTVTKQPPMSDEIEALREEVSRLRHDLAQAKQRIADLEARAQTTSSLPAAASDWRDARVLEALEPGDVLTLSEFRDLVESQTDIRSQEKITERVRGLAETDAFESVRGQRWRYRGPGICQ